MSSRKQACLPSETIVNNKYVNQEDLTKAARKVGEAKKHESELVVFTHVTIRPDPEVQQRWSSQRNAARPLPFPAFRKRRDFFFWYCTSPSCILVEGMFFICTLRG